MKKLLLLCLVLLGLYGCSEVDLDEVTVIDDINSIPTEVAHEDTLSPQMAHSISVITSGAKEFGRYINQHDLRTVDTATKQRMVSYISEIKTDIESVPLASETNIDKKVYETIHQYQYNLSKSIEYMVKYLETGNIDHLKMQHSYSKDTLENIRELNQYAEQYNF